MPAFIPSSSQQFFVKHLSLEHCKVACKVIFDFVQHFKGLETFSYSYAKSPMACLAEHMFTQYDLFLLRSALLSSKASIRSIRITSEFGKQKVPFMGVLDGFTVLEEVHSEWTSLFGHNFTGSKFALLEACCPSIQRIVIQRPLPGPHSRFGSELFGKLIETCTELKKDKQMLSLREVTLVGGSSTSFKRLSSSTEGLDQILLQLATENVVVTFSTTDDAAEMASTRPASEDIE